MQFTEGGGMGSPRKGYVQRRVGLVYSPGNSLQGMIGFRQEFLAGRYRQVDQVQVHQRCGKSEEAQGSPAL